MASALETRKSDLYVGFDSVSQQIQKKFLKRGIQLNLMVVGQSGLGKSTLIDTLFASHLLDPKAPKNASDPIRQTTEIHTATYVLEENGVRLKLSLIDTPGFGDQINNDGCWDPVVRYIKDQYATYLRKELSPVRDKRIPDTRVHALLYFISPSGHSLRPLDIIAMKKLSDICNLIPVIAKSDSLTLQERMEFKQRIREEISFHGIRLFPFEAADEEEDAEQRSLNSTIKDLLPFAIVGSERVESLDGKPVRVRKTKWGTIVVDNEKHCDFVQLRNFLTRTHLHDLVETTSNVHYEAFRAKQLMALKENKEPPKQ